MELSPVVVNRISVSNLEVMLNNQYKHDFNEKTSEDKGMSREDLRFMEIMESSATLQDERYILKLPLKKPDVLFPNNFAVAKQRILGLRRRFVNSPTLHKNIQAFLMELLIKDMQTELLSRSCRVAVERFGTYHTTVFIIPGRLLYGWCSTVVPHLREYR